MAAKKGPAPDMSEVKSDMVVIEGWPHKVFQDVGKFAQTQAEVLTKTLTIPTEQIPLPDVGKIAKDHTDALTKTLGFKQDAAKPDEAQHWSDDEVPSAPEPEPATMKQAQLLVKKKLGLEKGPTITLKCIDCIGGKSGVKDVEVKWDHSWEDVLRQLKRDFKRDVIFEYEVSGRVCRVHDDETFDKAIYLAEQSGNKLYVVIQNAVWETDPEEDVEPEEPEQEEQMPIITCANRMMYHPAAASYRTLLILATAGAALTLGVALAAISTLGVNYTYLFAHTITIAFPAFITALAFQKRQSDAVTVFGGVVGGAGACFGLSSAVVYGMLPAGYGIDGVIAGILIMLACLFNLWALSNRLLLFARKMAAIDWYGLLLHYLIVPIVTRIPKIKTMPWVPSLATRGKEAAAAAEKSVAKDRPSFRQPKKGEVTLRQRALDLLRAMYFNILLVIAACILCLIFYMPVYHAIHLGILNQRYQPAGVFVQRGDGKSNHILCRGFLDASTTVDKRPPVILEAMETLGQAGAMIKVQEALSRVGIVCAYDRAGFGYSPSSSNITRGPKQIANELYYMLTQGLVDGTSPPHRLQVQYPPRLAAVATSTATSSVPTTGSENVGTVCSNAATCQFVMVGHSAGSLYARTIARLYPNNIAALVFWDGLPSVATGSTGTCSTINSTRGTPPATGYTPPAAAATTTTNGSAAAAGGAGAAAVPGAGTSYVPVASNAYKYGLGPVLANVCLYYLEPIGILDLFLQPTILGAAAAGTVNASALQESLGDDYPRLVSRMLFRQWCSTVVSEYMGLFSGGKTGMDEVVELDTTPYPQPFFAWARQRSAYTGSTEANVRYCINGLDACDVTNTAIPDPARNHPDGASGWQCVAFKVLGYSANPYRNPGKRTCPIPSNPSKAPTFPCPDIARSTHGGTEFAPLQGGGVSGELVDTVLDAWEALGHVTHFPSPPIALTLQGVNPYQCFERGCRTSVAQFEARLILDLESIWGDQFRLENTNLNPNSPAYWTKQVWIVVESVERCPAGRKETPKVIGQLQAGDCPPIICPSLPACPSPFQSSPLYTVSGRRDGPDAAADGDDAHGGGGGGGTMGRRAGARRLRQYPAGAAPPPAAAAEMAAGLGPPTSGLPGGPEPAAADSDFDYISELSGADEWHRASEPDPYPHPGRRGGGGGGGGEWGAAGRRAFAEESFYVEFKVVGYKASLVDAAVAILSCGTRLACVDTTQTEDVYNRTLAQFERRAEVLTAYNVSSMVRANRVLSNNTWSSSVERITTLICPANTFASAGLCTQCPINSTSEPGSTDQTNCRCDANFYLTVVSNVWSCTPCPANSQAPCGSTINLACICNPGFTGPNGAAACIPCPLNTYKALPGDLPCTACNASAAGCDPPTADCHAAAVSYNATHLLRPGPAGPQAPAADWGSNCTVGAPTADVCVPSVTVPAADGLSPPTVYASLLDADECAAPAVLDPDASTYTHMLTTKTAIFQRCIAKNSRGACVVFTNLTQQMWPVYTRCYKCAGQLVPAGMSSAAAAAAFPELPSGFESPLCCFSAHLERFCNASLPGGPPAHCTEVPAAVLRMPGACNTTMINGQLVYTCAETGGNPATQQGLIYTCNATSGSQIALPSKLFQVLDV